MGRVSIRLLIYGLYQEKPWLILSLRLQQSPIAPFTGTTIQPKIGLAPVLRAGLGMTDALLNLFPYVLRASARGHPHSQSPSSSLALTQIRTRIPPRYLPRENDIAAR